MRIAYLRSNPVNPDPRVEKEVYSFVNNSHCVRVFCWDRSGALPELSTLKLLQGMEEVEIIRWRKKSNFGGGLRNIFKLIGFQFFLLANLFKFRKSIDVIHAADFDTVLPAFLISVFFKKKFVYDVYDFYIDAFPVPATLKPLIKALDFFVMNRADAVIITNESRSEQIAGAKPRRLAVIHNTPIEVEVLEAEGIAADSANWDITLVYVGILQPGRLISEIIDLFSQKKCWRIIVAGFGQLEGEILAKSRDHENIVYLGTVDYAKGLSYSKAADVIFATYDPDVPNHKYSSPNKLYEAMMLAKPIIVCKNTGIDKVVSAANIGLTVDYNIDDFERAVNCLISNKDLSLTMGKNARKMYEEHYSWHVMERRLLNVYKEL
ncbi:Glycosyltransferase involved in cell wall bisynthesis [Pseudomonas gessardii]|uniref:glycosyltransferase family 4 protein n=1 Tax=Pseudomonas gessardii TaxID=78544 RepID=UPI00088C2382|nr:glycosyltransferase family 4 protein [Pseudomonas gessardii]MRU53745.1 glycosyltransferase family 4 protein [Pseudomonas gessardii]ONH37906.1 hypothetical protein BLL38_25300 [Pseudomonas gessardii]SDQ72772.1 Glycosyltransferase involved in cell wall bisynthesis [Pseudomonas gessardii]